MITPFLNAAALTLALGAPANVVIPDVALTAPIVLAQVGTPPPPAAPFDPDELGWGYGGWGWR